MANFNLADYEQVHERIPKFLEKYDKPRIITKLMSPIEGLSTVVFCAEAYDGDTLLATGWAFEKEGEGYVNKTSHVENCETSAIGRALANLGLHGDKRPSREEMEKVERHSTPKKIVAHHNVVEKSEIETGFPEGATITPAMLNEMLVEVVKHKRNQEKFNEWLIDTYKIGHDKDGNISYLELKKKDYDTIMTKVKQKK